MKVVLAHIYGNTKEQVKEVTDILSNEGYEIAFESDMLTSASVIKEVVDEQAN